MTDRELLAEIIADANGEIAEANKLATTINNKGMCAEENQLIERLIVSRQRINQALEEMQGGVHDSKRVRNTQAGDGE